MNATRKDQLKQIISTRKLAQKVGCSESYLSQVLNGHRSRRNARFLRRCKKQLVSKPSHHHHHLINRRVVLLPLSRFSLNQLTHTKEHHD
jgi:transcriptional regulator with XRE-family HTH domain